MQVNAALDAQADTTMDMPCHDLAADGTDSTSNHEPGIKHNCSACGACFTILATGMHLAAYFSSIALTSRAAMPAEDQTVSQTYPPALRPPIAS